LTWLAGNVARARERQVDAVMHASHARLDNDRRELRWWEAEAARHAAHMIVAGDLYAEAVAILKRMHLKKWNRLLEAETASGR